MKKNLFAPMRRCRTAREMRNTAWNGKIAQQTVGGHLEEAFIVHQHLGNGTERQV